MNDRTLTARIVTEAPLHLGAGDAGLATDLPVLRDAAGAPYLPGTQVAGRLREIATRLAPALGWPACTALDPPGAERTATCTCPVCDLFGHRGHRPEGDETVPEPAASRLWCFDAPLVGGAGRTLVRDGVGISRRTGAAAADAQALYDAEWLPTGSKFDLRLELEHRPGAEPDPGLEAVLALALSEWREGRGRLGGGAARGGGAFRLEALRFRRADLSDRDRLLDFLTAEPCKRGVEVTGWPESALAPLRARVEARLAAGAAPERGPAGSVGGVARFAELRFRLAFEGALLVNDPAVALAHGIHGAPVHADPEWTSPALPGAAVRGVLRSQVERIARTAAARAIAERGEAAPAAAFARACPACDPFDTRPYGPEAPRRALRACAVEQQAAEEAETAAEAPADCPACALFGSTRRGSRLWIADAQLAGPPTYRLRDFVAIDRFTGGALGGAKFDALPLYGAAFDVRLLLWEPEGWEVSALALALRDLDDGLATVGSGGAKDFGRARVRELAVRAGEVAPGGLPLGADEEGEARWSGVFRMRRWTQPAEELVEEARRLGWMQDFAAVCAEARREVEADAVPWDAWYGDGGGGGLSELYPLVVDLSALEAGHGS